MRVRSDLFVAALSRRVFSDGGFAAVLRKGAAEAGAIFVVVRSRDGSVELFGPAPQSGYGEGRPAERIFVRLLEGAHEEELSKRLDREVRFDPDTWIVELDTGLPVESLIPLMTP